MLTSKKIHFAPITVVIGAVLGIIICFIIMISLMNAGNADEMFSESYAKTEAVCLNKEISSQGDHQLYFLELSFKAVDSVTGNEKPVIVRISETDPRLADVDQGGTIDIYYRTANVNFCHPAMLYPDYTIPIIILWVLIAACVAAAGMNIVTIVRNKDGYVPKYEKPEDIGTLGEAGADSGLCDNNIDYSAGDVFSDKLMDSFVDPFATYTGYEETENPANGNYYDPNAGYSGTEQYQPEPPAAPSYDPQLNNPYATAVNSDPDNPYNKGTYDTPASMFGDDSNYNSAEIYGDSSFGSRDDMNSTDIFGSSSFGAAKNDPPV